MKFIVGYRPDAAPEQYYLGGKRKQADSMFSDCRTDAYAFGYLDTAKDALFRIVRNGKLPINVVPIITATDGTREIAFDRTTIEAHQHQQKKVKATAPVGSKENLPLEGECIDIFKKVECMAALAKFEDAHDAIPRIQAALADYNVRQVDLEPETRDKVASRLTETGSNRWCGVVIKAISRLFFCRVLRKACPDRSTVWTNYEWYGTPINVESASAAALSILEIIKSESNRRASEAELPAGSDKWRWAEDCRLALALEVEKTCHSLREETSDEDYQDANGNMPPLDAPYAMAAAAIAKFWEENGFVVRSDSGRFSHRGTAN